LKTNVNKLNFIWSAVLMMVNKDYGYEVNDVQNNANQSLFVVVNVKGSNILKVVPLVFRER
jgi:hypothetical protein